MTNYISHIQRWTSSPNGNGCRSSSSFFYVATSQPNAANQSIDWFSSHVSFQRFTEKNEMIRQSSSLEGSNVYKLCEWKKEKRCMNYIEDRLRTVIRFVDVYVYKHMMMVDRQHF